MSKVGGLLARVSVFALGMAAGVVGASRRLSTGSISSSIQGLSEALIELETRVIADGTANSNRILQIESRLDEHSAKLADVPSKTQIVAIMEQVLSKTLSSLDARLTTQAQSIEMLKTTVARTDMLLERVLESVDSLRKSKGSSEHSQNPPHRSA